MRRSVLAGTLALLGAVPLHAQLSPATQVLPDVFPANANTLLFALTADAQRAYFLNPAGEVWFFDRAHKTSTRLTAGNPWDLAISPTRNALAYTKSGAKPNDQYVWIAALDPQTGLATSPERRLSANQGDVPAISPDGKWVAFARDDSTGVGQSIVVVPAAGGTERVVVPALPSSVDHIRWTPDGKTVYFGVNPPVACTPDWSCLPLPHDAENNVGTIRRAPVAGGPATILATTRSNWPGLSPDGKTLVYTDTGNTRRIVVADASGRRIDSFMLPATQTITGWLSGSMLLVRSSGTVRQLRSARVTDSTSRLLYEGADRLAEPSWSGDGKTISVIRCAGGTSCELRILNADGSLHKAIPLADVFVTGIAWSPDQRWITYTGLSQTQPTHLVAMEIATGRAVSLSEFRQSSPGAVLWLPDSRGVIVSEFVQTPGTDRRVVFRQIDLAGKSTVLREIVLGRQPSVGMAIDATTALVSRSTPHDYRLARLVGDSSESVILPDVAAGNNATPTFSQDHQWLAIRRSSGGAGPSGLNVVELVRADGTARSTIELPFNASADKGSLVILPGAKELIVVENLRQDTDPGIYLVTVATKNVKKLFTYPSRPGRNGPPEIAISPDGRTLLYALWDTLTPSISTMDLSSRTPSRH